MLTYPCGISNASVKIFETSCQVNAWASVLCFDSPRSSLLEMPAVLCSTPCVMLTALYLRLRITSQFTCQAATKISHILLIGTNK